MALTIDSKLSDLLKDKRNHAIIDRCIPGGSTHPMIAIGKMLTLKAIITMPTAKKIGFTREMVEKILAEVNALPPL